MRATAPAPVAGPRWDRHDAITLAVIAAAALLAGWPLLTPRLIATHDGVSVLARLTQTVLYAGRGQWLVRWAPNFQYGYGGPLFQFYPPGFFYAAALVAWAGLGLVRAIQLTALALWMLSGAGAYLLARRGFGRSGACLAAVAFVYSPYHISLVYVRGAMAEFAALALLPVAVWLLIGAVEDGRRRWRIGSALALAALVVTHHFLAMVAFGLFALGVAVAAWRAGDGWWRVASRGAGCLGFGVALSAWFWLPMLAGWRDVAMDRVITANGDYHRHFLALRHVLGLGRREHDVAMFVGPVHAALAAVALARLPWIRGRAPRAGQMLLAAAALAVASAWMMLPSSAPVWELVRPLQAGQFPWRFQAFLSLGVALLAGGAALAWPWPVRRAIAAGGIAGVIAANLAACVCAYTAIDNRVAPTQAALDAWRAEYRSLWWEDFMPRAVRRIPQANPPAALRAVDGQLEILEERLRPVEREWRVRAASPVRAEAGTLDFPGWRLWIDRRPAPVHPAEETGVIAFDVPAGDHNLRLAFEPTAIVWVASLVSLAALVLLTWPARHPLSR